MSRPRVGTRRTLVVIAVVAGGGIAAGAAWHALRGRRGAPTVQATLVSGPAPASDAAPAPPPLAPIPEPPPRRASTLRNDVPAALTPFQETVERQAARFPDAFFLDGPPAAGAPRIALTFDDGPGPLTPAILDTLERHGARATFFLVGENARRKPEVVKRIVGAGHAIGVHGYRHLDMRKMSTGKALAEQIERTRDVLEPLMGRRPWFHRPPYGAITDDQIERFAAAGVVTVNWSIDSYDWRKGHTRADQILAVVERYAHDGAIVLLHDAGGDRSGTVEALPALLQALDRDGYTLVTVPELLGLPEPAPAAPR